MKTINNSLVKKNWGNEYAFYRNKNLSIWKLFIEHNQQTSTHMHSKKNTSLIALEGMCKVSFLNNSITLKGLDKVNIFARRFHSTKALSKTGCHILEVETPEDKTDLVRLFDSYGRENQPYESSESYIDLPKSKLVIPENSINYKCIQNGCLIEIKEVKDKEYFKNRDFEEVFVFLDGGLTTNDGKDIIIPGDTSASHHLELLTERYPIKDNTVVMSIKKNES